MRPFLFNPFQHCRVHDLIRIFGGYLQEHLLNCEVFEKAIPALNPQGNKGPY
jgi:hypothetical protein